MGLINNQIDLFIRGPRGGRGILQDPSVIFYLPCDTSPLEEIIENKTWTDYGNWFEPATPSFQNTPGVVVSGINPTNDDKSFIIGYSGNYSDFTGISGLCLAFWTIGDNVDWNWTLRIGFGSGTDQYINNGIYINNSFLATFYRIYGGGSGSTWDYILRESDLPDPTFLVVDIRYSGSDTWLIRESINGADWSDVPPVTLTVPLENSTYAKIAYDSAGPPESTLDEVVLWANNMLFTERELSNLYELANTNDSPMPSYSGIYGEFIETSGDMFINGINQTDDSMSLFVHGHTPSQNLFIKGHNNFAISGDLFIEGFPTAIEVSENIPLFLTGVDFINNNTSLYIRGLATTSGQIDLFINGFSHINDNTALYINGHVSANSDVDLFVKGYDNFIASGDLFINGIATNNDNIPLYLNGHLSINDNTDLFINGYIVDSNSNDLFTHGYDTQTISGDLYICGNIQTSGNISLYHNGYAVTSESATLFIEASGGKNDNIQLYINGYSNTTASSNLFVQGYDNIQASGDIFIEGVTEAISTSEQIDLFIRGYNNFAISGDLFIEGFPITAVSGDIPLFISNINLKSESIDLFIKGIDTKNNSIPLYIDGIGFISDDIDLFIEVSSATTILDNAFLFIKGIDLKSESVDLFVTSFVVQSGNIPLYINGLYSISDNITLFINNFVIVSENCDLYVSGNEPVNDNVTLYINGVGTATESGNISLIINGLEPREALSCPILDPTASIQISDQLIAIYQSRIDALINQLGKNIYLEFDPIRNPCPNCRYNTVRKRSTGIYIPGGPRPFARGRKCPFCKGRGLIETPVNRCIKCLVKWNPQEAAKFGISIERTKGIVRFKTFLTEADDIRRAKTAISNHDIADQMIMRVKLIQGPIPVGLREDRYCISFWEAV